MDKKKVLFICKYNRFRSKIAEARLKAVCPGVLVRSRGIIEGRMNRNVHEVSIPHEYGLNIKTTPHGVRYCDLEWADYVVVVANNVPKSLFRSRRLSYKIIQWDVDDIYPDSLVVDIERVVRKVVRNTDLFCEGLGKGSL